MATSNVTISATWTKLATADDDPVLVTSKSPAMIEFATTATDVAPTVTGHAVPDMSGGAAMTRMVIGDGFLWCRIVDSRFASASVEVSK
jgi:hypothetical protein